jgi:sterol desaturase/sphingolipid hydroxylase (fatty acid hydroxylase superfamily)
MEWLIYALLFFLAGPFVVELVGYFWHRWVEHRELLGKTVAFRHYKHHETEYPVNRLRTNEYRNANSWTWYVVGISASIIAPLVAPIEYAIPFALGAWVYAWGIVLNMHTAFHVNGHFLWKYKWFQKLVKLHDIHHYDNVNYGICLFFMDRLFGTYTEDFPTDKNGDRVKYNMFVTYQYHTGVDGRAIKG